ncbi:hypothetical protein KP509_18G035200 [Ceratopteris richardii]|nr:hypothetical protein KP509_18G035200 [Ceratopteris richardii]
MDRNLSESFGNDDENDNISVGLDKTESETDDDVVTDMSDSVEIEDTDEDTSVGLCEAEGDKVSSIASSKARDLSHLKKSPYDRSRLDRRPPVRPSKKERSAGLSPRTIRDDDSDDIEIESDLEGELQEEIKREMEAEPKFRRPSVTWGILLSKEHREAAREVIKYLETEGIDTNMLKQIELPTAVEVMQTRLGFLRKIGLDNEAINNYPLVLGCSVYKNMVPVLKYLKKLGFPQHWVSILVRKYPMILHASVVIDILPVIYFLRGLDIDLVDIPRVLTRYPDLLGFKTEGTMSTSVAYLVSVGVGVRHVGYMLTEYPEILGMRVATVIKPKFDYLMSLGIPQTIVARIIERRPYILGYHLESRMQSNVNHLLEIGVRKEAIPGMIAQFPDILGRILSVSAKDHASWFKDKLMLETDKVAGMIEKMPQVILIPTEMALERIRFLKSQHFTTADIGQMVSQCPQILISSIFSTLRPNLNFLTSEMKRLHTDVVDFPEYFTYSLEGRIKPRFRALTNGDRDLNCSLDWLLNCSDLEFEKRLDGRSDVVDEMVGPSFIMGGQLPGKPEKAKDESHSSEAYEAAAL